MISESEFSEWLHHEVTEEFFRLLAKKKEEFKESWVNGTFTRESVDGTAQANAEAIGGVQILDQLLDLNYDGFKGNLYE